MTSDCAIAVRNCSKSFSKGKGGLIQICEQFHLTVPRGSIYALLGPSSCGKTSLIRAILGRIKIDTGGIWVLGRKTNGVLTDEVPLSDIGYMPQETCLYDVLTIGETLAFYGRIKGLSKDVIRKRTTFYVKYLQLPNKNAINRNLSGGQRRRVSFAASIFHHPKILLLDEPTVGLDPIIRQSIWKLLNAMASTDSVSILLTTHFIEEAKSANSVGIWHGKSLQVEAAPSLILSSLKCNTLDEAFYRICSFGARPQDGATSEAVVDTVLIGLAPRCDVIGTTVADESERADRNWNHKRHTIWSSLRRIAASIQKNMIQLFRFPSTLLYLLVLPPFIMIVFCSAFGKFQGLQLAVRTSDTGIFGSWYFRLFDPNGFNQTLFTSINEGRDAVLSGHQYAFVNINENFTAHVMNGLTNDYRLTQKGSDTRTNDYVTVYLNGVDYPLNMLTKYQCAASLEKLCFAAANYTGAPSTMCEHPLRLQRTIDGADFSTIPIRKYFIPGILIMLSYFVAFQSTVVSFFLEKRNGYMERGYVAGLSTFETMFGYIAVSTLLVICQTVGIMLVSFLMYEATLKGSTFLVFMFLLWTAFGGMSAGFMLSSLTDDLYVVFICACAWLFYSIPLSGWIWPISAMPKPLLLLSYFLPFALPIQALIGITHHGWGFFNFNVMVALAVTTAWLPIWNGVTFYMLRAKKC